MYNDKKYKPFKNVIQYNDFELLIIYEKIQKRMLLFFYMINVFCKKNRTVLTVVIVEFSTGHCGVKQIRIIYNITLYHAYSRLKRPISQSLPLDVKLKLLLYQCMFHILIPIAKEIICTVTWQSHLLCVHFDL